MTKVGELCQNCLQAKLVIQRACDTMMSLYGLPMVSGVCVECGLRQATARDHRRYSLPLNVDYVCTPCNTKRGPAIDLDDLIRVHRGLQVKQTTPPVEPQHVVELSDLNLQVAQFEKGLIEDALKYAKGNITKAAGTLGVTFRSLRHRVQKLGVRV